MDIVGMEQHVPRRFAKRNVSVYIYIKDLHETSLNFDKLNTKTT